MVLHSAATLLLEDWIPPSRDLDLGDQTSKMDLCQQVYDVRLLTISLPSLYFEGDRTALVVLSRGSSPNAPGGGGKREVAEGLSCRRAKSWPASVGIVMPQSVLGDLLYGELTYILSPFENWACRTPHEDWGVRLERSGRERRPKPWPPARTVEGGSVTPCATRSRDQRTVHRSVRAWGLRWPRAPGIQYRRCPGAEVTGYVRGIESVGKTS
jgi:hypothetical protein